MTNQVQCPNCGGYLVDGSPYWIDRKTGKRSGGFGYCGLALFSMLSLLGLSVLALTFEGTECITPLALLMISIVVIFIWRTTKELRPNRTADMYYKYDCRLCGYHWELREGQPPPDVHVRPDLIEKGQQRLEQERRKRED